MVKLFFDTFSILGRGLRKFSEGAQNELLKRSLLKMFEFTQFPRVDLSFNFEKQSSVNLIDTCGCVEVFLEIVNSS